MILNQQFIIRMRNFYNEKKGQSISVFLKENKDINQYVEYVLKQEPWFQTKFLVFTLFAKGIYKAMRCKICGKLLQPRKARRDEKYCSCKCSSNDSQLNQQRKKTIKLKYGEKRQLSLQKRRKTCLQKYGVDSFIKTKEFQDKRRKTCLQKYGTEYSLQSKQVREKIEKTNLQRYGYKLPLMNEQIKNKFINNNLRKYGVRSTAQLNEVKQKIFKTNMQRYGCKCSLNNENIKEKAKQTILQKYGVDQVMKSEEIRKRASDTQLSRSYDNIVQRWKDYVIPLFDKEHYYGFDYEGKYRWKCVKCGEQFQQQIYTTGLGEDRYIPRCLKCLPNHSTSIAQKDLLKFIKTLYSGDIIENDRKLISPFQLDIVIPEQKLAIQFNGNYWHSLQYNCLHNYHLNKTEQCQKLGYRLIHIWQDDWRDKQILIKQKLKDILNHNEKIEGNIFDRCWYSTLQFQKYEILPPKIILRNKMKVENCGYIKIIDDISDVNK